MASYNNSYPPLAALTSGAPDSPAAGIIAGTALDNIDVIAATRQRKRRCVLHHEQPRRATPVELQAAVNREFSVLAENATGNAFAPAWAVAIQNQLADLHNLQRNSATYAPNHAIFPIRNAAGNLPENFPANRLALDSLTNIQVGTFLTHYGLPLAPVATRLERLKLHLGIRP